MSAGRFPAAVATPVTFSPPWMPWRGGCRSSPASPSTGAGGGCSRPSRCQRRRASAGGAISRTVTAIPFSIRFSATSSPIKPPPTTTAFLTLFSSIYWRAVIASSGVRTLKTPGRVTPLHRRGQPARRRWQLRGCHTDRLAGSRKRRFWLGIDRYRLEAGVDRDAGQAGVFARGC